MNYYKYRSIRGKGREYTEDLLLRGIFYFSNINSFNDPFEFEFKFDFTASFEEKIDYFKKEDNKIYEEIISYKNKSDQLKSIQRFEENHRKCLTRVRNLINENMKVFCLSSTWNNITLWSHYADSHRGICIEFVDLKQLDERFILNEVKYKDNLLSCNIYTKKGFDKIHKTKHKSFENEKEYRLVGTNEPKIIINQMSEIISKIYLGINFDFSDSFVEIIQNNFPEITIVKLMKSKMKYAVEVEFECFGKELSIRNSELNKVKS